MAHEITELKDTVLRNPPWDHETGAEEFQYGGSPLLVRPSPWGSGPYPDPESGSLTLSW